MKSLRRTGGDHYSSRELKNILINLVKSLVYQASVLSFIITDSQMSKEFC